MIVDYSAVTSSHELACGNIYIRTNTLDKGGVVKAHAHNFDHTMFVCSGSVSVTAGDAVVRVAAPDFLLVRAGVRHEIEALEDGVMFRCVYAHRTPQGDVVQEYTGWDKAHQ